LRLPSFAKVFEFCQLQSAREIDDLQMGRFDFFRSFGILDYEKTFKAWLRKFPRPIFIAALRGTHREVVGWNYVDEWNESSSRDGFSVHVVRAIEVQNDLRRDHIGAHMLKLSFRKVAGHVVAKPVSVGADQFFLSEGFRHVDDDAPFVLPIDLPTNHVFMHSFTRLKVLQAWEKDRTAEPDG